MDSRVDDRRGFLSALGALGISAVVPWHAASTHAALPPGFVLAPGDGEHLVHFRDGGDICIKLSQVPGSTDLSMGTQQVKVGTGIPQHRHVAMEEAFLVLQGRGAVWLAEEMHSIEAGSFIFIPRMTWHAFENREQELLLLWLVTPPGLEAFFRETCSPPGAPPKGLSREQIREAARRHGTEFR